MIVLFTMWSAARLRRRRTCGSASAPSFLRRLRPLQYPL
jgi:hypothetical protein